MTRESVLKSLFQRPPDQWYSTWKAVLTLKVFLRPSKEKINLIFPTSRLENFFVTTFLRAFSDVCIGSIEWVAMEGWTYIFRHFKRGFNDFSTLAMICQSFWFKHSLPQAHQCHHPLSTQLIWCRVNRAARFILGALGTGIWNEDNEEVEGKLGSLSFSLFTFNWIQLSANERRRRRKEISKHEESWRELNAQG